MFCLALRLTLPDFILTLSFKSALHEKRIRMHTFKTFWVCSNGPYFRLTLGSVQILRRIGVFLRAAIKPGVFRGNARKNREFMQISRFSPFSPGFTVQSLNCTLAQFFALIGISGITLMFICNALGGISLNLQFYIKRVRHENRTVSETNIYDRRKSSALVG